MHTPQEIMNAIRNGLDSIPPAIGAAPRKHRTVAIKAKLCEIGRLARFNCTVCAAGLPKEKRTHGEWLYDVIWLKYHDKLDDHPISCVPLVAECEWGTTYAHIKEDFQKLLLARASVRLMIYKDPTWHDRAWQGAEWTARRLAAHINRFNRSRAEDAWMLAAWKRTGNPGFAFTYFTIRNDQVFIIRPDGTEDPLP